MIIQIILKKQNYNKKLITIKPKIINIFRHIR